MKNKNCQSYRISNSSNNNNSVSNTTSLLNVQVNVQQKLYQIQQRTSPLTELVFNAAYALSDPDAIAVANALRTNRVIEILKFKYQQAIGTLGWRMIAQTIRCNMHVLRYLSISDSYLHETSAIALLHSLVYNTTITTVVLKNSLQLDNPLKSKRIGQALRIVLKINRTIQELKLSERSISRSHCTSNFVIELADGLRYNTTLNSLTIAGYSIGSSKYSTNNCTSTSSSSCTTPVSAIATALYWNSSLTTLRLERNNIGTNELQVLAPAIRYHPTLQRLFISLNPVDDECINNLTDTIRYNDTLLCLGVTGSRISPKLYNDLTSFDDCNHFLNYNDTIQVFWVEKYDSYSMLSCNNIVSRYKYHHQHHQHKQQQELLSSSSSTAAAAAAGITIKKGTRRHCDQNKWLVSTWAAQSYGE